MSAADHHEQPVVAGEPFFERSYERHSKSFEQDLTDEHRKRVSDSWFRKDTADYWRHSRFYTFLECFADKTGTWITVGDGRWGLDSLRIREKGFSRVLPTDICETLLLESKKRGFIDEYSIENAEALRFDTNSFDYAFCKESLHHFPRPYAAIYEMLRVARLGVFIAEPMDHMDCVLRTNNGRALKKEISTSVQWEPKNANYVYTFSRHEACKIALALDLPQILFSGLNDQYVEGCEFEPADTEQSAIFREIVEAVYKKDFLCEMDCAEHELIQVGFMKQPLDEASRQAFSAQGWDVIDLPRNQYI